MITFGRLNAEEYEKWNTDPDYKTMVIALLCARLINAEADKGVVYFGEEVIFETPEITQLPELAL